MKGAFLCAAVYATVHAAPIFSLTRGSSLVYRMTHRTTVPENDSFLTVVLGDVQRSTIYDGDLIYRFVRKPLRYDVHDVPAANSLFAGFFWMDPDIVCS